MPTTSNFGWTTPADTDLVKDGAAAIRTLGNGIDTSLVDLKGGTTGQNLRKATNTDLDFTWAGDATNTVVDAEGDLLVGDSADTLQRLAIGTTNQVLTVDTSIDGKIKWAAVSAGPVELATSSLAGVSTLTFSAISGAYKTLLLEVKDSRDSSGESITVQINGSSTADYAFTRMVSTASTLTNNSGQTSWGTVSNINSVSSSETSSFFLYLPNYAQTNVIKTVYGFGATGNTAGRWFIGHNTTAGVRTAAITSITINNNAVNWVAGTATLFGVN